MIRKYIADIVSILIIISGVIVFAGKPYVNFNPPPAAIAQIDKNAVSEIKKGKEAVRGNTVSYEALEKRNIFTEVGVYAAAEKSLSVLPPNPYTLVAVLQGNDKKAVFREYTGAIVTVPVGKKMIDEYVVQSIEGLTVKLKRGNEGKKLTVFNSGDASDVVSPDDKKKLSATPYKLIGILNGKERKAVIRDYKNSVIVVAVGAKLGDGSVVTGIGDVLVRLKKGKENIELKIFGSRAP
jgi:hypothetical protein